MVVVLNVTNFCFWWVDSVNVKVRKPRKNAITGSDKPPYNRISVHPLVRSLFHSLVRSLVHSLVRSLLINEAHEFIRIPSLSPSHPNHHPPTAQEPARRWFAVIDRPIAVRSFPAFGAVAHVRSSAVVASSVRTAQLIQSQGFLTRQILTRNLKTKTKYL